MHASERRTAIKQQLLKSKTPISASAFATLLGVSRQIVVGDIALLRAAGEKIEATPRGYRIERNTTQGYEGIVACIHEMDATLQQELYCVVDHGGIVEDVAVENPLYGELRANLHITNRYEATEFCKRAGEEPNSLLSRLTGGVHLHTIRCADETTFLRIKNALQDIGILYEK